MTSNKTIFRFAITDDEFNTVVIEIDEVDKKGNLKSYSKVLLEMYKAYIKKHGFLLIVRNIQIENTQVKIEQ